MSGARKPPQARDRMLGARLRSMRRQYANLSLEAAAHISGLSLATMSRIENGKRHVASEDVATLLALYGVPQSQRAALINEARTCGTGAGQWVGSLAGVLPDMGMASHETGASAVVTWSTATVPSLLQPKSYAIGTMLADGIPASQAEHWWKARQARQEALHNADHTAFIHEAALRTPFGGIRALGEQLRHLIDASHRGVGVRVVRIGTSVSTIGHSWNLLSFPDAPPVVHIELPGSSVYLHTPETDAYERHRAHLWHVAHSVPDTRDYLTTLEHRLRGEHRQLTAAPVGGVG